MTDWLITDSHKLYSFGSRNLAKIIFIGSRWVQRKGFRQFLSDSQIKVDTEHTGNSQSSEPLLPIPIRISCVARNERG